MQPLALLVCFLLMLAGWCAYAAIVLSPFLWAFVALLILSAAMIMLSDRDHRA